MDTKGIDKFHGQKGTIEFHGQKGTVGFPWPKRNLLFFAEFFGDFFEAIFFGEIFSVIFLGRGMRIIAFYPFESHPAGFFIICESAFFWSSNPRVRHQKKVDSSLLIHFC